MMTIALSLVLTCAGAAQEDGRPRSQADTTSLVRSVRIYAFGNVSGLAHVADFTGIPDIPSCCTSYGNTIGYGWEFGAGALWRLDDGLHAGLRIGYGAASASFASTEPTVILKPTPRDASIAHSIDATITSMSYTPTVQWYLSRSLFITGALMMRYAVATSMVQDEVLQAPDGAVFIGTGTISRNRYEGPINGVQSISVAPEISVGYDLPLNKERSWMASVELAYQVLIPGYVAGIDWYSHALKVQVSVARDLFTTRATTTRRRSSPLGQGQ